MDGRFVYSGVILIWLAMVLCVVCGCAIPKHMTPLSLAGATDCDIPKISWWISQHDYEKQPAYVTAIECLALDSWDCKCAAVIGRDTLTVCGYNARIISLLHNDKRHAITIFSGKGKRGYIDNVRYGIYSLSDSWDDVIGGVGGGPWRVI